MELGSPGTTERGILVRQMPPKVDIYGGRNPVEIPAYSIADAGHHLQLPKPTVRSWVLGRNYPTQKEMRRFLPVILIADPTGYYLSFQNLVELHVLSALRRKHFIRLRQLRRAIGYLRKELGTDHPLWHEQMETDGKDLFVRRYGELVNITQEGQMEMDRLIGEYLRRVARDPHGIPIRLFPFTSTRHEESRKTVVIDPLVEFGRPCIAGTGTPTAMIADRYKAGDSIALLADDYGRTTSEIEEALRFEFAGAA